MVIGNIVKPGKLKMHQYAQCHFENCRQAQDGHSAMMFISYNSVIFWVRETDYGLEFYPTSTSPRYSRTTAKHTLWALYALGYSYKQAHIIIDGLCTKHKVKA